MARETVFIGFGSNVGDRLDFCDRAIALLNLLPESQLMAASSLYETEPVTDVGNPGPGWFLNGVVSLDTELTPQRLLSACREVERALGRERIGQGGPRTMDLDILFYGARIIRDSGLDVPHPRLHLRRFVLMPLAELDREWRHPVYNRTVDDLLGHLADTSQVRRLDPSPKTRYGSRPTCNSRVTP